jgi:predicted SnoaL-like aldol condensation-catalyzing enzyme
LYLTGQSQGRAAGKDMIAKGFTMFDKALPDLKEEVVSITAEGDRVACQVMETATFTGPMDLATGVVAPTNRSYKLPVASFFRVDAQGFIVEQRTYWDTANWAKQIGIDPQLFAPKDSA